MPRYFLHVQDRTEFTEDPEGAEFDNLGSAIEEAKASARELMAERLEAGGPLGLKRSIVIADEHGDTLAKVPFSDALPPEE